MVNKKQETLEKVVSITREEIIKEAKRIEESTLFSSKGHFAVAAIWNQLHLWLGIPTVILSGVSSTIAFSKDSNHSIVAIGMISIIIAALSSLMTFLNPNEKSLSRLRCGNCYDSLQNKVRIFWTIDCKQEISEQVLYEKLKYFSEQKDRLNQDSPQIPQWAYKKAKKGIESGETIYAVDVTK